MKVDVPKKNTAMIGAPIFECYVIRYGSKNWHQIGMFKIDWAMCSNYANYLGWIVNMIGGAYMTT